MAAGITDLIAMFVVAQGNRIRKNNGTIPYDKLEKTLQVNANNTTSFPDITFIEGEKKYSLKDWMHLKKGSEFFFVGVLEIGFVVLQVDGAPYRVPGITSGIDVDHTVHSLIKGIIFDPGAFPEGTTLVKIFCPFM